MVLHIPLTRPSNTHIEHINVAACLRADPLVSESWIDAGICRFDVFDGEVAVKKEEGFMLQLSSKMHAARLVEYAKRWEKEEPFALTLSPLMVALADPRNAFGVSIYVGDEDEHTRLQFLIDTRTYYHAPPLAWVEDHRQAHPEVAAVWSRELTAYTLTGELPETALALVPLLK